MAVVSVPTLTRQAEAGLTVVAVAVAVFRAESERAVMDLTAGLVPQNPAAVGVVPVRLV